MSKLLTLLLIFTMLLPPLQSFGCESAMSSGSTVATSSVVHDENRASHPAGVHQDRLTSDPASAGRPGKSNCCDPEGQEQSSDCDEVMNCASCPTVPHCLAWQSQQAGNLPFAYRPVLSTGEPIPSHDYPPYRPPIS